MTNIKLSVELIPTTCHFSNVRTTVTPAEWDKIRFISYAAANNKCEICGSDGLKQGYKHRVECHEVWDYNDENKIQKLIKLISLCVICHQVKHIGRATIIGKQAICHKQLALVNKWTPKQVMEHIAEAFEVHKQRSKHKWKLDISILKNEPYNLNIKNIDKRIFEVKKFKKKKTTTIKKPYSKTITNKKPPKK